MAAWPTIQEPQAAPQAAATPGPRTDGQRPFLAGLTPGERAIFEAGVHENRPGFSSRTPWGSISTLPDSKKEQS